MSTELCQNHVIYRRRIVLNVSGEIYETYEKTLKRFPETLLGDLDKRKTFYCSSSRQYFFNRNRLCFGAILYFYQSSGMLTCPLDIKIEDFEEECSFFQLPNISVRKMKMKRGIIIEEEDEDDEEEATLELQQQQQVIKNTWKSYSWDFLENPESSKSASLYAIISLIMVFISVCVACMETVIEFKHVPWGTIEMGLSIWFLTELIFRTIFCPNKKKYFKSSMTWIDILAVIPYFVILVFTRKKIDSLSFLRIIRFLKIMRLFRLSKHSKRLKIVGAIVKSSVGDLQLLLLCLSILMIFGGSLMYYVEGLNPNTQFTSIPQSLWWAVQTVTTVGYGDIIPSTYTGKLIAASFMLFGAVTISLPVLSIVAKFTLLYSQNMK